MWTFEFIMSQVCVIFAVLSLGLSYFTKNRVVILILALCNSIFYGLQYLFLHEYAGAVLNFIGILRGVWFFVNDKLGVSRNLTLISLITCLSLLILGDILTFGEWYSIFPLIATVTYTLAVWQKNITVYRWTVIPIETCGVIYNIMCGSIIGIVLEVLLLIFGIVSIIKLYVGKNKKQNGNDAQTEENSQNNENKTEETPA